MSVCSRVFAENVLTGINERTEMPREKCKVRPATKRDELWGMYDGRNIYAGALSPCTVSRLEISKVG